MRLLVFISSIFLLIKSYAQQDFILYHMPSIPQITQVDPASIPDSKVNIGLPIITLGLNSVSKSTIVAAFKFEKKKIGKINIFSFFN